MDDLHKTAYEYLEHGQNALKAGDITLAKEYCDLAENNAPDLEEVWLLKATLAEPNESVEYLRKALEINPRSDRAKKGLLWAEKRLNILAEEEPELDLSDEPVEVLASEQTEPQESLDKNPFKIGTSAETSTSFENTSETQEIAAVKAEQAAAAKVAKKPRSSRWLIAPLSILALVLLIIFGAMFRSSWFGALEPILSQGVMGGNSDTIGGTVASTKTIEPTNTSLPTESGAIVPAAITATLEKTATLVPTLTTMPSATASPLPTNSPVPSVTLTFSAIPYTESDLNPTATPSAPILMTVTPNPALIGVPSPTPLPTDTDEPEYTYIPPAPPMSVPIGDTNLYSRWIDVNLSQQMVYAYEGDVMVNAFVVSSGTWQYPTVTGQYNVYVKYLYKDMWGDDYYLPDVPYTMFFYDGYAIHGTYWHNNFGVPMSHGCVNMTIPDAGWIYQWASVGTMVNVHY